MRRLHSSAVPGKQIKIKGSAAIPIVQLANANLFTLTTAITTGVTTDSVGAVAGDFAVTTNATGRGKLFTSNGTVWVDVGGQPPTSATFVAALTGTSGGTANGALEDEGVVTTAGGNTYADSAINTPLGKVKNNVAELATKLEAVRAALVAAGLMAAS
jgi:hypothetical protein